MRFLPRRFRFAFRSLRNAPAFSLLVIVILALGIGANTAVFSVVDAVLLRQLPYGDPDRLVVLWEKNPALGSSIGERVPTSYTTFAEWVRQSHSFEDIAGFESANFNRTGAAEPERVDGARVSPNFFHAFNVDAALGTTFNDAASDPSRAHVAVLSDGYWRTHFSSDPGVIGQSLTLNESVYTIIGILPARFYLPAIREGSDQRKPDIWLPYDASALGTVLEQNRRRMLVFARLRPGISINQARAEMSGIARRLQDQNPTVNAGFDVNIFPISAEDVDPQLRRNLLVLLSAVGLVLLIACANISNLVLSRAAQRQRVLAIRKALGAGRGDLIAQVLTESAVLSILGGALALAVAYSGIHAITSLKPAGLVRPEQIHLGGSVLIFTMVASFIAAALFGVLPALRVSRIDVNSVLKSATNAAAVGRRHLSSSLVLTEVALATVLLIGAGFMVRSLQSALKVDPGFHADQVLTLQLSMPPDHYTSRDAMAAFCRDVLARISTLPGVRAASFSDGLPMTRIRLMKFIVEGQPTPKRGSENFADMRGISSPGYFSTLGIPILAGRNFTADEINQNLPVLVVNQALAKRLWPGQSAVGMHLLSIPPPQSPAPAIRYTVIAVQGNARQMSLEDDPRPEITRPMPDYTYLTLAVRSTLNPTQLTTAIEHQILAVDKSLPVYNLRTMQEVVDETLSERRFSSLLLTLFSGLGMLLACLGIYGILTFTVVQRTREIGIRMALGATRANVLSMVLRNGLSLVFAGILIGLAIGLALARVLASLLFGLSPTNPATYAFVFCGMLLVAAAACYLPARRATAVQPTQALRYE